MRTSTKALVASMLANFGTILIVLAAVFRTIYDANPSGNYLNFQKLVNDLWGAVVANSWWLWIVLLIVGLLLMVASVVVLILALRREHKETDSIEILLRAIVANTNHDYPSALGAKGQDGTKSNQNNTKATGEDSQQSRTDGE